MDAKVGCSNKKRAQNIPFFGNIIPFFRNGIPYLGNKKGRLYRKFSMTGAISDRPYFEINCVELIRILLSSP